MTKKLLPIPKFKNEDEERNFWDKVDLSDYFDFKNMVPVSFPNLKRTNFRDLKEKLLRDKEINKTYQKLEN